MSSILIFLILFATVILFKWIKSKNPNAEVRRYEKLAETALIAQFIFMINMITLFFFKFF